MTYSLLLQVGVDRGVPEGTGWSNKYDYLKPLLLVNLACCHWHCDFLSTKLLLRDMNMIPAFAVLEGASSFLIANTLVVRL